MSNLAGTNVAAMVVPFTTEDEYATGYANYIKGGRHSVATLADRNKITKDRREQGMNCYVVETDKTYELKNNPDTQTTSDSDWKEASGKDKTYVFVNDRVVEGVGKLEFFHDQGAGKIIAIKANLPSETVLTEELSMAIDCLVNTTWTEVGIVKIPIGQTHGETLIDPGFSIDKQFVRQRIINCEASLTNLVVKVVIS
jgi:hypothetical protein